VLVLLLSSVQLVWSQVDPEKVRTWVEANALAAVQQLGELAEMPAVASNPEGLTKTRRYLAERLGKYGFTTKELDGGTVPSLFAQRMVDPQAETLLLYFHYDGQEVDPSKWMNDPFTPTLYDPDYRKIAPVTSLSADLELTPEQRIVARAVSDDKGPIAAFLVALRFLEESGVQPAVNLKLFLDGDEESGSPGLRSILENAEYAKLLAADALIILDAPRYPTDDPTIYLGTRGIVTADLTIYGPSGPLHSGHYGNWAVNPAIELSRVIASMVDEDGRVLVQDYYKDRVPLTEDEKQALARLPNIDAELQREFGLTRVYGSGRRLHELITYPSLNVRGMQSMYVGEQARTVIPDRATAALDLRLVPNQTDEVMLARVRRHLERLGYYVINREPTKEERGRYAKIARFRRAGGGYPSFRTPIGNTAVQRTIRIVEEALGEPPVVLPTIGGSGPLVLFKEVLGIPPFGIAIYNHDCNQHSPNENIRLREYFQGVRLIAGLLGNYGR
jgi:acetylornithine deacetylase/succinyl-diaminopimelate desuccinylase-like protein